MAHLSTEEAEAIASAMLRGVHAGSVTWDEIKDRTLSDFCSINQDALIEDLYEDDPRDRSHRPHMLNQVRVYDRLLGTHRADKLPAEWLAITWKPAGNANSPEVDDWIGYVKDVATWDVLYNVNYGTFHLHRMVDGLRSGSEGIFGTRGLAQARAQKIQSGGKS